MNYAIILAGGVGQRMLNTGMPKQFLEVFGKPIIIYTLEKFEECEDIDRIVISCNSSWIPYMKKLLRKSGSRKIAAVVPGGQDRQGSVRRGIDYIVQCHAEEDDIVVIHDGVRPLVEINTITENVRIAKKYGSAITVKPVVESVIVTDKEKVEFNNFKKRDDTYSLTSPQTFQFGILRETYKRIKDVDQPIPLLDAALCYTYLGNEVRIVKENNNNIKITTPEDFYIFRSMCELQENRYVFGL